LQRTPIEGQAAPLSAQQIFIGEIFMASWDALYTQQYDSTLRLASQQQESRLLRTVTIDKMAGARKYFEKILALGAPAARSARATPVILQDTPFERRALTPVSYEDDRFVDTLDTMRSTVVDPSNMILMEQAFAQHRNIDDIIIGGITGTAYIQSTIDATLTPVTLPGSQIVPVGYDEAGAGQTGNTGMTVGKLKYGLAALKTAEAVRPGEEVFAILNSVQIAQLLRDPQITNIFYNDMKPLTEGLDITRALGLTIIRSERIPNTSTAIFGTGQSTALMYPMSAAMFSWLEPLHGRVDYRPDLQGETYQLKSMASFGATRMFEEKVVEMVSDNTQ
jgi:hypothetical protein